MASLGFAKACDLLGIRDFRRGAQGLGRRAVGLRRMDHPFRKRRKGWGTHGGSCQCPVEQCSAEATAQGPPGGPAREASGARERPGSSASGSSSVEMTEDSVRHMATTPLLRLPA